MLEVGALTTITPAWVAALTSTLSRPTPARATTLSRLAAASASASTLVAERTRIASTSAMAGSSSARSAPLQWRISKSGPSASTVAGLSSSAMSTTGLLTAMSSMWSVGVWTRAHAARRSALRGGSCTTLCPSGQPYPTVRPQFGCVQHPYPRYRSLRGHPLTTPCPPPPGGPSRHPREPRCSTTLTLTGLDVAFGARTLVSGLDLVLSAGDVTALVGPNGSGKSSLMRTLVGELPVEAGSVRLAPADATIGWLPQTLPEPGGVAARLRPAAYRRGRGRPGPARGVRGAGGGAGRRGRGVRRGARALAGARRRRPRRPAAAGRRPARSRRRTWTGRSGSLSGGQAARAALASVLLSRYDVLLLDEPTNNLDARGLALMAEFVTGHEGPVLVASHDRDFLDRVATRVVELDLAQQRIGHYAGGWSDYVAARDLERRQAREAFEEYAGARDRLVAQSRQRADWAATGPSQRGGGRRARQARPGEAQGPCRPSGRQGGADPAVRRPPARRWRSRARSGSCATRSRPDPRPPRSCGPSTGSR